MEVNNRTHSNNGGASLRAGYRALAPQGRLITYGAHTMLSKGRGRPNWLKLAWDFLRMPRFSALDMSQSNKALMGFNLSFLFARRDLYERAIALGCDRPVCVPEGQGHPAYLVALGERVATWVRRAIMRGDEPMMAPGW